MDVWLWILIALAAVLLIGIAPVLLLGYILYSKLLVRTSKEIWNRGPSDPSDPEYVQLYEDGMRWRDAHLSVKEDVHIENDGLNLYGEYYDLGAKTAAIILPGRMETCYYSAFYAEPYEKAGCNVLTIDPRGHGLSDGKYNSLGFLEYRDVIAWAKFLHDTKGVEKVFLHGVCIGCSTAVFALTAENCPEYVAGMVAEGMYVNFNESFRIHIEERGHRYFPVGPAALFWLRLFGKADAVHDGPLKRIPALRKPILMLHSRMDQYSLPDKAELLYEACGSPEKELVWFETGTHSRIRIHTEENRAKFDAAIGSFLTDVLNSDEHKQAEV